MKSGQSEFLKRHRVPFDGRFSIRDFSCNPPSRTPPKKELKDELDDLVGRLDELQQRLFADERYAVLAVRPWAPWYAIPADDKTYMRTAVARIMVETLKVLDPQFPKLDAAHRRELKEGLKRLGRE